MLLGNVDIVHCNSIGDDDYFGWKHLLNSTHFNEGFQQSFTITESYKNSYLSFVVEIVKILKLTVNVRFQVISFLNAYCH